MNRKICTMALAVAAGGVCGSTAVAQNLMQNAQTRVEHRTIQPTRVKVNGKVLPQAKPRSGAGDAVIVVYDNAPAGANGFYFWENGPTTYAVLDRLSFTPGGASGGPVTLTQLDNIGFTLPPGDAGGNLDVLIDVYNTVTPTAPVGTPVNTLPLGTQIVLEFDAVPPNTTAGGQIYTLTLPVDISAAAVTVPDDDLGVKVTIALEGTQTLHPTIKQAWNGNPTTPGQFPSVGSSADNFWFDFNLNGIIESNESYWFNGGTFTANLLIKLEGDYGTGASGACCLLNGTCAILAPNACTIQNGVYRGDNTTCAAPCPQPCANVSAAINGPASGWPVTHGQQNGRLFRDGVPDNCTIAVAGGAAVAGSYNYDKFDFTNSTGAAACVTVAVNTTCAGTSFIYGGAYVGGYNPALPDQNNVASFGSSPNPSGIMSFNVPAGAAFSVVFTETTAGTSCPNYTFQVVGNCTGGGGSCYANCDLSTTAPILNVADFICFQIKYAGGDSYANCDGSTVPPVLNVADFICFQTKYAAGCT